MARRRKQSSAPRVFASSCFLFVVQLSSLLRKLTKQVFNNLNVFLIHLVFGTVLKDVSVYGSIPSLDSLDFLGQSFF